MSSDNYSGSRPSSRGGSSSRSSSPRSSSGRPSQVVALHPVDHVAVHHLHVQDLHVQDLHVQDHHVHPVRIVTAHHQVVAQQVVVTHPIAAHIQVVHQHHAVIHRVQVHVHLPIAGSAVTVRATRVQVQIDQRSLIRSRLTFTSSRSFRSSFTFDRDTRFRPSSSVQVQIVQPVVRIVQSVTATHVRLTPSSDRSDRPSRSYGDRPERRDDRRPSSDRPAGRSYGDRDSRPSSRSSSDRRRTQLRFIAIHVQVLSFIEENAVTVQIDSRPSFRSFRSSIPFYGDRPERRDDRRPSSDRQPVVHMVTAIHVHQFTPNFRSSTQR
jgi:hypothetical protein